MAQIKLANRKMVLLTIESDDGSNVDFDSNVSMESQPLTSQYQNDIAMRKTTVATKSSVQGWRTDLKEPGRGSGTPIGRVGHLDSTSKINFFGWSPSLVNRPTTYLRRTQADADQAVLSIPGCRNACPPYFIATRTTAERDQKNGLRAKTPGDSFPSQTTRAHTGWNQGAD
ncbi:hypothetical protein BDU57DRAFT_530132 [Ampelomyces quisqualis]|uniref:Uncharacterized protein n=1 Tax=Ampelomyces quisqualis TaxID=50730 RepID=A0A6A5QLY8_AMPQU|nr:hypothetical protein BDU57DRAFT_530132 [Ampelomyces quisqualis]